VSKKAREFRKPERKGETNNEEIARDVELVEGRKITREKRIRSLSLKVGKKN